MYPFAAGLYALRIRWCVAARSAAVGRAPLKRFFLDEPVALAGRSHTTACASRPMAATPRSPARPSGRHRRASERWAPPSLEAQLQEPKTVK